MTVEIPSWLVKQFELESGDAGLKEDEVHRFSVEGDFKDKDGNKLDVELEACSGQSNWWATINVFRGDELLAQTEPFFDIVGHQEFTSLNGEFNVVFKTVEAE
jgi:hypothetical protein